MLLFGILCDIACYENVWAKKEIVFRFEDLHLEFI